MKYDWVDTKIVGTTSIMSTKGVICEVEIMVGDPLKWPIILVGSDKMIYSSFDDYVVPFYGCLFTKIGLCLPFYDFKVIVLKHLEVAPF